MKKGVVDIIEIMTFCIAFSLIIMFLHLILTTFNTSVQANNIPLNTTVIDRGEDAFEIVDDIYPILPVGLGITTIMSAFMIQSHPMFFVVNVLALVFVVTTGGILSNVFALIAQDTSLAAQSIAFSNMITWNQNWPIYATVLGVIFIIALVSKRGQ